MRTLVAIPVYNELKHVDGVLAKARRFNHDILVIDDGSTDGTAQKLAERQAVSGIHVLQHRGNQGYGQSLIDAFAFADRHRYDWVITMDCDEQHEPEMIPAFKDLIAEDRWDLISGSRYRTRHEDDNDAPQDRAAINAALTRLLNSLYPLSLTDSFCGFKAHRVSAMKRLGLTERGYAFPMQLWPQLVHAGLRMTEMSVRRIYVDPKRSFGGQLDQPTIRLTHYLDVLAIEHQKLFGELLDLPTAEELLAGTAQMPTRNLAALPRLAGEVAAHDCRACCCG